MKIVGEVDQKMVLRSDVGNAALQPMADVRLRALYEEISKEMLRKTVNHQCRNINLGMITLNNVKAITKLSRVQDHTIEFEYIQYLLE